MLLQRVKRDNASKQKSEAMFIAIQATPQSVDKQKGLTRKEETPALSKRRQFADSSLAACVKACLVAH